MADKNKATWTRASESLPAEGVTVEATTPSGDVRTLVRLGGMWFLPDRSMYVYFDPVMWRVAALDG